MGKMEENELLLRDPNRTQTDPEQLRFRITASRSSWRTRCIEVYENDLLAVA